jgi:hypothetical protein
MSKIDLPKKLLLRIFFVSILKIYGVVLNDKIIFCDDIFLNIFYKKDLATFFVN